MQYRDTLMCEQRNKFSDSAWISTGSKLKKILVQTRFSTKWIIRTYSIIRRTNSRPKI